MNVIDFSRTEFLGVCELFIKGSHQDRLAFFYAITQFGYSHLSNNNVNTDIVLDSNVTTSNTTSNTFKSVFVALEEETQQKVRAQQQLLSLTVLSSPTNANSNKNMAPSGPSLGFDRSSASMGVPTSSVNPSMFIATGTDLHELTRIDDGDEEEESENEEIGQLHTDQVGYELRQVKDEWVV